MSENKKARYNECYVTGTILNIGKMEVKFEGTPGEREVYRLDVEVSPEQVVSLVVDNTVYGFDGQPSKKAEGALTIYNEARSKTRDGYGDVVKCICKIDNQQYYSNGELKEFQTVKAEYVSRVKEGEIATPQQIWVMDTLIKSIEDKDGYVEVKGLVNDYLSKNGNAKGTNLTFRITDEDIMQGFKEMYQVGCIAKLTGEFREVVTVVDTGKRTFGKVKSTKPTIDRWLEIIGGEEAYNVEYGEDGVTIKGFVDIEDNNHPFSKENIEKMETALNEKLQKSKDKDAQKMANTQQLSDENVPF